MTQMLNDLPSRVPAGITNAKAAHLAVGLVDMAIMAARLGLCEEAESMRLAAQAMCPEVPMLDVVRVSVLLGGNRFEEALRSLDGREDSIGSIYRAYCLYRLGDPVWETSARETLVRNDVPEASRLARRLFEIAGKNCTEDIPPAAETPVIPVFIRGGMRA